MLPRLNLSHSENILIVDILSAYLSDTSSIVNTFVMQAFAEIARKDDRLHSALLARISELTVNGSPAMQARGRKLLDEFKGESQ